MTVSNLDDDAASVSVVAPVAGLETSEGGGVATFTVVLDSEPTADVTIDVKSSDKSEGTVSPASLTFTSDNWNTAQTVTVTGVDDDQDDGNQDYTILLAAAESTDADYDGFDPADVTVSNTDDDEALLVLSPEALTVDEGGEGTWTVALASEPAALVTVTVTGENDGAARVGSTSLTFTPADWNVAQNVTVSGLDDEAARDERVVFAHTASGGGYDGVTGTVTVTVLDTFERDSRDRRNRVASEWLPRFGRTVSGMVPETLGGRLARRGSKGDRLVIGGRDVNLAANDNGTIEGRAGDAFVVQERIDLAFGTAVADDDSIGVSLEEFLRSSSFAFYQGDGSSLNDGWAIWGESAGAGFSGADNDLLLDGTVISGAGGIEYDGGDWLGGLALFHSRGEGSYGVPVAGSSASDDIEAWLTSVHPYVRFSPDEATMIWGTAGYGQGRMMLSDPTGDYETDIAMGMGAFGASRQVLSEGGFDLAVVSDAFWTHITSDEIPGLDAVTGNVYRLRAGLEGGYEYAFANDVTLRPTLEIGARYDGGDVETGAGLEVGGNVRYENSALGLTTEVGGRVLLLHSDEAYDEWGVSGLLRLDPGSDGQGLSLSLQSAYGMPTDSMDLLDQDGALSSLASEREMDGQVALTFGFGMLVFDEAGLLTPRGSMMFNDDGSQHYGVGLDLTLGPNFILDLQSSHRFDNEYTIQIKSKLQW